MQRKSGEHRGCSVAMEREKLEDKIENIQTNILIYGAHLVALECARWLIRMGKKDKILGFAVTDMADNPKEVLNFPVRRFEEYECENICVVIAVPQKFHYQIEQCVKGKGISSIFKVSLEEMAEIRGRELLLHQEQIEMSFRLEKDEIDPNWLNMVTDNDSFYSKVKGIKCKFPTVYHLDEEQVWKQARKLNFPNELEKTCGPLTNLSKVSTVDDSIEIENISSFIHIYMAFSQWDNKKTTNLLLQPWIFPLQVGSRMSEKKSNCNRDETGDNISELNRVFAEMTGAYWIWKNDSNSKYKGLCHYRRHFNFTKKTIHIIYQNEIDVILATPRYAPDGIKNMFMEETPVKEIVFQTMWQAISELFPEDMEAFVQYMDSMFYYPNNMVVAKNEVYNSYCAYVFPILFKMSALDDVNKYGHLDDRHIAYAAELLTSFFFIKNKGKYIIATCDYKLFYSKEI